MSITNEIRYLASHEWGRIDEEGILTVGISDHAQSQLGDIVYVELPEIGKEVEFEGDTAIVESVKAASDVYSPISGEIVEINDTLEADPAQVNTDPMGDGWFVKIKIEDPAAFDKLLDEDAYKKLTQ